MHISRTHLTGIGLALAALTLSACGDDSGANATAATDQPIETPATPITTATPTTTSAPTTTDAAFPVTVTGGNGEITIDERPERIVVLSASLTESVFAVGAGEQVIAVDSYSNHPADAPTTELSAFRPNIEAIGEYEPDLVLVSRDRDDIVATLEGVGIDALVLPSAAGLEDVYAQIETVGLATGHAGEAERLAASMRTSIDEQLARIPDHDDPPTYFYELSGDYHSVTSDTFVGSILDEIGLVNIADGVDEAAGAYPQLSAEYVLDSDPDHLFFAHADGRAPTDDELAERAGWSTLTAIDHGRITRLDPNIASRWGPRVVDLVGDLVDAVADTPG